MRPKSKVWWFFRFRRAYKKHGAKVSWRQTWDDAVLSQRMMPAERQHQLPPINMAHPEIEELLQ